MISNNENLTQKQLKDILHFDLKTGVFRWAVRVNRMALANQEAGTRCNGYIAIMIKRRTYKAHRLAWLYVYGVWPKGEIDHKDHNRANNRIENLREVTRALNAKNHSLSKANISGYTGVRWHKGAQKWIAKIVVSQRHVHLGCFKDINDAIKARESANIKYGFHPNHGKTNKQQGIK